MIKKRNITLIFIILPSLFSSCSSENKNVLIKEYSISGNTIEEIVSLPGVDNPTGLDMEIKGDVNKNCTFYYSHCPFDKMNEIKLNGLTDRKIRTDWYDNRCKIVIMPEGKDTTGSIKLVFKLY